MSGLIFYSYDIKLHDKSILEFLGNLDQSIVNTSKKVIYRDLLDLVQKLSTYNGDLIDTITIFQKNKVLNGHFIQNQFTYNIDKVEKYSNLIKKILIKYNIQKENIVQISQNFEAYTAGKIESEKYEKYLQEQYNKIKLVDFFNNEISPRIIGISKNVPTLGVSYIKLGLRAYLFGKSTLEFSSYCIFKSIKYSMRTKELLNGLNLLNMILIEKSTSWNLSIYKIFLKIFLADPKILEIGLEKQNYEILAILTETKKYTGQELLEKSRYNNQTDDIYFQFLLLKYFHLFSIDISHIKSVNNINELHSNLVDRDIENVEKSSILSQLVIFSNLVFFYLNILGRTNYNPDEFVIEEDLTNYLLDYLKRIKSELDKDKYSWWFNDPIVKHFENMVLIKDKIFFETEVNNRLIQLIDLLDQNNYVTNYLTKRILYFCVDNFEQLDHQLIVKLSSKVKNDTYLTIEGIIAKLLENLIFEQQLSDRDLYYLNTYLNQNVPNNFDYSQEKVAELIVGLIRLERSPQMPLYQENGAVLIQKTQAIQEGTATSTDTLHGTFLTSIPEELVDLIDDYQDLINYVKLFYEYQTFIHEWREYKSIDEAYQQLKNMQTVMETLEDYEEEMRLLKFEYPQIIDGITLDLLEAELILTEEPSIAYGVLSSIDNKINRESLTPEDQGKYFQLLARCQT